MIPGPPQEGDRIQAVSWWIDPRYGHLPTCDDGLIRDEQGEVVTADDNRTVPPGTLGTVTMIVPGSVAVEWDNGSHLNLLDRDEYVVVSRGV